MVSDKVQADESMIMKWVGLESVVHLFEIIFLIFTYQAYNIADVNISILILLYLSVTFIYSVIKFVPSVKKVYFDNLKKKQNPIRWIEYTQSSTLMVVILHFLITRITDIGVVLIALECIVMILLGYFIEVEKGKRTKYIFFTVSTILFLVIWIHLGYDYFFEFVDVSKPMVIQFVARSLFWIELTLFSSFPVNMLLYLAKYNRWKNYYFVERNYILLSIFSKSFMFWILWIGILSI